MNCSHHVGFARPENLPLALRAISVLRPRLKGLCRALPLKGLLISLAGFFLLTACASNDEDLFSCPRIYVPKDSAKVVKFKGEGRDLTDVLFESQIGARAIECELDDDAIEMTMLVSLKVGRGPVNTSGRARFSYYVAVARSNGEILAREEFPVEIALPGNQTLVEKIEEIAPEIPLKPGENGTEYGVFVGFALSPAEYEYNRRNR